jgi:hypothetical protein
MRVLIFRMASANCAKHPVKVVMMMDRVNNVQNNFIFWQEIAQIHVHPTLHFNQITATNNRPHKLFWVFS